MCVLTTATDELCSTPFSFRFMTGGPFLPSSLPTTLPSFLSVCLSLCAKTVCTESLARLLTYCDVCLVLSCLVSPFQ
jgi:hypothetical protein